MRRENKPASAPDGGQRAIRCGGTVAGDASWNDRVTLPARERPSGYLLVPHESASAGETGKVMRPTPAARKHSEGHGADGGTLVQRSAPISAVWHRNSWRYPDQQFSFWRLAACRTSDGASWPNADRVTGRPWAGAGSVAERQRFLWRWLRRQAHCTPRFGPNAGQIDRQTRPVEGTEGQNKNCCVPMHALCHPRILMHNSHYCRVRAHRWTQEAALEARFAGPRRRDQRERRTNRRLAGGLDTDSGKPRSHRRLERRRDSRCRLHQPVGRRSTRALSGSARRDPSAHVHHVGLPRRPRR